MKHLAKIYVIIKKGFTGANFMNGILEKLNIAGHSGDPFHRVFIIVLILVVSGLIAGITLMSIGQIDTREKRCLALNIYHEARGESIEGQIAVATVAINRKNHSAYPDTLCEVIYEYNWNPLLKKHVGQFSWTVDDLSNSPAEIAAWKQAVEIAGLTLAQGGDEKLSNALHYHALEVMPRWARKRKFISVIGRHRFYY